MMTNKWYQRESHCEIQMPQTQLGGMEGFCLAGQLKEEGFVLQICLFHINF